MVPEDVRNALQAGIAMNLAKGVQDGTRNGVVSLGRIMKTRAQVLVQSYAAHLEDSVQVVGPIEQLFAKKVLVSRSLNSDVGSRLARWAPRPSTPVQVPIVQAPPTVSSSSSSSSSARRNGAFADVALGGVVAAAGVALFVWAAKAK
jgi:hypothetical protein